MIGFAVIGALVGQLLAPPLHGRPPAFAPDSTTTTFTVGGVRVIHRRAASATVVANLYLLGGVRAAPDGRSGLENFLLQVSERGTARYPRDILRRSMARTGSEMVIEPREDWTLAGLRTVPAELDSAWAIFKIGRAHV